MQSIEAAPAAMERVYMQPFCVCWLGLDFKKSMGQRDGPSLPPLPLAWIVIPPPPGSYHTSIHQPIVGGLLSPE
jgi:hypothetical protein